MAADPHRQPKSTEPTAAKYGWTAWLLVLPYLALCFPAIYARATPAVLGFPFFYWYQFVWVALTSALLLVVYKRTKSR